MAHSFFFNAFDSVNKNLIIMFVSNEMLLSEILKSIQIYRTNDIKQLLAYIGIIIDYLLTLNRRPNLKAKLI